jgi:hypothetical protein
MNPRYVPRAVSRARWLAELSAALDEAQALLTQLAVARVGEAEANLLRLRIDELRAELQSLHRRSFATEEEVEAPRLIHPDWRPRRDRP